MKRLITFTLALTLILCAAMAQQPRSNKRGAGTNNMAYRANFEVLNPGLSWFYNWTFTAPTVIANDWESLNLEYVPMTWGGGLDREGGLDKIRAYLSQHPSIKYILGFNEPNFTSQSRMTPKYAASQWPYLEQIADEFNLTIVGPALNFGPAGGSVRDEDDGHEYTSPYDWYDKFFSYCPDCRVDHIAIHLYMPTGALQGTIDQFWQKYHRPIWLTEFNYNSGGSATPEDHMRFLTSELEMLEKHPHVFRYAWFMTYSSVWQINLLDLGEGKLTDLGKLYVGMSSFDSTYYHSVGEKIPAAHYQNAKSVTIRTSTDDTNTLMLKDMSTGSWAEYLVEVPKSDTYKVFMHLACKSGSKIDVYEDDQLVTTLQPTATSTTDFDTWGTQQFDVPLTAGKHRLKFYSNARLYYYEWLSIGETTAVEQTAAQTLPAKCIENGQLLIHANGRTYNAFGQAVD